MPDNYVKKPKPPDKFLLSNLKGIRNWTAVERRLADKRAIVQQTNPLLYLFGYTLKPYRPHLTYEENLDANSEAD